MFLGESSTPPGLRLYAIGDIHGRDDLLAAAHERIADDLLARPADDYRVIHMGDYVDRGPTSAAVVERLAGMSEGDPRVICLMGNHEQLLERFLDGSPDGAVNFLANGGIETLESYGVHIEDAASDGKVAAARQALLAAMPDSHLVFLAALRLKVEFGDYFFCHAGIRPGVALADQTPSDLIWIRGAFHQDSRDHGKVVIHAHSPVPEPDVRPNRINIDTGAWYSDCLTCLALDGTSYRFV